MATPGAPPALPLSPSEHPSCEYPPGRPAQRGGGVLRAVPAVSPTHQAPSLGSWAPGAISPLQQEPRTGGTCKTTLWHRVRAGWQCREQPGRCRYHIPAPTLTLYPRSWHIISTCTLFHAQWGISYCSCSPKELSEPGGGGQACPADKPRHENCHQRVFKPGPAPSWGTLTSSPMGRPGTRWPCIPAGRGSAGCGFLFAGLASVLSH